jgi:hypothetical protein
MSFVYAVQMQIPDYIRPVKIGFATTRNRLATYNCGPFPVLCLGTWKGHRSDEQQAHKQFAEHRLSGEWFYPAPDLLLFVQSKTGLVALTGKRQPDPLSIKRLLSRITDCPHKDAVNAVVDKAREVMARFRVGHLSDAQLRAILGLPGSALAGLKERNQIGYQPDARYSLHDLIPFLQKYPELALAARWRDWREVDELLYQ